MTYYWMGHSIFLTISASDHALTKEGFNSFTGGKKHYNSIPDDYERASAASGASSFVFKGKI